MALNKAQLAYFVQNKAKIKVAMGEYPDMSMACVIDLLMAPSITYASPRIVLDDTLTSFGRDCQDFMRYPWQLFKEEKKRFISLKEDVEELFPLISRNNTIFLIKPVQSGKTSEVLKIIEHTYKTSCTILISTLTSVAGQTNKRAGGNGWTTRDFSQIATASEAVEYLHAGKGKKVIAHFLMEHNNLSMLIRIINMLWCPITLIIDEGDKNRSVESEEDGDDISDEKEVVMPPVTRMLQVCKNRIAEREDGSKTIYVTATPAGLFCAEKDTERLVIVKEPFKNWRGVAYNHPCNVEIRQVMRYCTCKARDRWTGNFDDITKNTYRDGVKLAIQRFNTVDSKDESIKQIMLISLENHTKPQARMAEFVDNLIDHSQIDMVIFNGINKVAGQPLLSDRIGACKARKIIVISGFMASRGVSFTDFSDPDNKFELVAQVHAAKRGDAINASLQAMRIYGPDRKTVSRPIIFCNNITAEDNAVNFLEYYRVVKELAEGQKFIFCRNFNPERPITPACNRRYMVKGRGEILLLESPNPKDHELINEC
jgi:hypothetical protein